MPDERFDTFPLIEDRFVALIPNSYSLAQQLYIDPAQLGKLSFHYDNERVVDIRSN
jgi:hypothetical protein